MEFLQILSEYQILDSWSFLRDYLDLSEPLIVNFKLVY